jgi:hypothetical protein
MNRRHLGATLYLSHDGLHGPTCGHREVPVTDYHFVLTVQGGSATQPMTHTFSGTRQVDHGYSRKAVYDRIVEACTENRRYQEFFQGDFAVLFFSLEPDRLE